MTPFDTHAAAAEFSQADAMGPRQPMPASTQTVMTQSFTMSIQNQDDWQRHLALAGLDLPLDHQLYTDTNIGEDIGVFNEVTYEATSSGQTYESVDTHKAARQARRKAQNRAAQRKFRERKDNQMRTFEQTIEKLTAELERSKCEISELQGALTEAKTQVETLKSILPSLAKHSATEDVASQSFNFLHGQEERTVMLNALVSSLLQSGALIGSRKASLSTPSSASEESSLHSW